MDRIGTNSMKTRILFTVILSFFLNHGFSAMVVTPGYSFATNEIVTAQKLNDLVEDMSITGIDGSSQIANLSIGSGQLGANSVISSKILDGTIVSNDIASATISGGPGGNIATNTITGLNLSTNFTFPSGNYSFTNSNTTVNFTNANLGFTSGQIPITSIVSGGSIVTNTQFSLISTNIQTTITHPSSYTWTNIITLVTTATNGNVQVRGSALAYNNSMAALWVRVRDNTTNVVSVAMASAPLTYNPVASAILYDTLSGSTKTYFLDVASSGASQVLTNTAPAVGQSPEIGDGLSMKIFQTP